MPKKFAFSPGVDKPYDLDSRDNMLSNYSFHVTDKKTKKTTHHVSERHLWESYPHFNQEEVGADLEHSGMNKWLRAGRPETLEGVDQNLHYEDDHHIIRGIEASNTKPGKGN